MPTYFVTGTDTDAGKTLVSSALLALARRRGLSTLGLKPVASGSTDTREGLRNADALALQAQSTPDTDYELINPFAFEPAIAPHLAARRANMSLRLDDLEDHTRPMLALERDFTLIEGAGGWRVPLNNHEDLAGLAVRLELPVILVVGLELGCINHARLTAEAITGDGLTLAGWVGNSLDGGFAHDASADDNRLLDDNLTTLARCIHAPCLGMIPRLATQNPAAMAEQAADWLELPDAD
ncbi:dethiobiotin synthase [Halomonas urumqiensis]|uniref:ATP-dependent dethiobiotin synthetase BioD n=1 Tax=Halomonas urumqiensis TaxID=1684789 RepID=A0A2N7UFS9_9GAMM|nr:dethiobiotin synthase [Halomonas urumqiensis]PMR79318.1 dethiobiotin synthase [Halomonas urumqiensis]PTB04334.1 dethiobiotin synthase [Halomonas urumqiensis]